MGTYVKRGSKQRAIVRKNGVTMTKTFNTVAEAKTWIAEQETVLEKRQEFGGGMTLGDVLQKHIDEVIDRKPYPTTEGIRLRRLIEQLGHTELADITQDWWIETVEKFGARKDRALSPASRMRYLMMLIKPLKRAQDKSKGTIRINWDAYRAAYRLLKDEGTIGDPASRARRPEEGELEAIKAHARGVLPDIIDFAVITGMRLSELVRMQWTELNEVKRMLHVRQRKHCKKKMQNNQIIPLLGNSLAILQRQPKTGPYIFPVKRHWVKNEWRRARKLAEVHDLRFHDLRHEAVSRMFEMGYSAPEVCLVSGHHDLKSLKIYTNLKGEDLHLGPAAVRALEAQRHGHRVGGSPLKQLTRG